MILILEESRGVSNNNAHDSTAVTSESDVVLLDAASKEDRRSSDGRHR